MNRSDDPYTLLPLAFAGIVVGLVMTAVFGDLGYDQLNTGEGTSASPKYAEIEGPIAWAGWRTSAVAQGARWFLQIRIEDDHRGYIVAAEDVPETGQARFGSPGSEKDTLSELVGKPVAVTIDSSLLEEETPYMAGLSVGGEPIISADDGSESPSVWIRSALVIGYGMGTLMGLGILGASVQHVVVCVRHWRREVR